MYRHRIRIGRAELEFIGPVAQHARGVIPWVIQKQGRPHRQRALDFLIALRPSLALSVLLSQPNIGVQRLPSSPKRAIHPRGPTNPIVPSLLWTERRALSFGFGI